MTPLISTKSVFLDKYQESDKDSFAELLSDPEVMLHVDGVKSNEQIIKLFQRALGKTRENGDHIWAIRRKSDKAYAGHAALFRSNVCTEHECEILFYLLKPYWGQGHATEVAQAMIAFAHNNPDVEKIWATINSDHLASRKVCEKAGMRFNRRVRGIPDLRSRDQV